MKFHVRYILISLLAVISAGGCVQAKELSWSKYREVMDSLNDQVYANKVTYAMFASVMLSPGLNEIAMEASFDSNVVSMLGEIWGQSGRKALKDVTKQVCRKQGISLKSLKRATEKHGVSGMPYDSVFDEYFRLMTDLSTSVRNDEKLDESKVERASRLAYDLGINPPRTIVRINPRGQLSIFGRNLSQDSVKEELKAMVLKNPHMLFQLTPDSLTPVSALFEFKGILRSFLEDVPAESLLLRRDYNANDAEIFVKTRPLFLVSGEFYPQECTELVTDTHQFRLLKDLLATDSDCLTLRVDSSGNLFLNDLPSNENGLAQVLDSNKYLSPIAIYPSKDSPCGKLMRLLNTIYYRTYAAVFVVDPRLVMD